MAAWIVRNLWAEAWDLKPLLLPFSFSDGQVGVFRPVVLPLFAVVMDVEKTQFGQGCTIRSEPVGDDGGGRYWLHSGRILPSAMSAPSPFREIVGPVTRELDPLLLSIRHRTALDEVLVLGHPQDRIVSRRSLIHDGVLAVHDLPALRFAHDHYG